MNREADLTERLRTFAFSSLDSTIRAADDSGFVYELYNFHEGYYHTVEEAQVKYITSMPAEDPHYLLGVSVNEESMRNYSSAHSFLEKLLTVDKQWDSDAHAKLLYDLHDLSDVKGLDAMRIGK